MAVIWVWVYGIGMKKKKHEKALELLGRLQGVNCLVAEEAGYHPHCLKELQRPATTRKAGRPSKQGGSYETLVALIQAKAETGIWTLGEVHNKFKELCVDENEQYGRKYRRKIN